MVIVCYIGWGEDKVNDFSSVIYDQMNFEAKEPARRAFSSSSLSFKDLITMNSSVMAYRQRFGIYEIPATMLRKQYSPLQKNI